MASEDNALVTTNSSSDNGLLSALKGFEQLPGVRQLGLIVFGAAVIAVAVAAALWSQSPNYTLLYGHLGEAEKAEVIEALSRHQIEHRIDAQSGAVLVPGDQVHRARLQLAAEELPRGDALAKGYELLDQDTSFTMTQKAEESRHQRALEGELARSISSLSLVQSARVHLAIAPNSSFVRDRRPSSASVIVHLYQGKKLAQRDVDGIVHLVAASVANLDPEQVAVVDQHGRLLTDDSAEEALGFDQTRFDFNRRVEQNYVERVVDILVPVVGPNGVRAQVDAILDFTQSEHTEENYDPAVSVIRSERLDEENTRNESRGEVPGALTNQPPAAGTTEPAAADTDAASSEKRSSLRNFELDRRVSHTRLAPGSLQRLSVAVVIDHKRERDEEGNIQTIPRTEEEIAHVRSLVEKAVGFNDERGDSVVVINTAFHQPEALPLPEPDPIWTQPWVWQAAKQVVAPLVLIVLLLMILRPTIRNLAKHAPNDEALAAQAMALPGYDDGQEEPPPADESQIKQAVSDTQLLVAEDPARAAQVVREWVTDQA